MKQSETVILRSARAPPALPPPPHYFPLSLRKSVPVAMVAAWRAMGNAAWAFRIGNAYPEGSPVRWQWQYEKESFDTVSVRVNGSFSLVLGVKVCVKMRSVSQSIAPLSSRRQIESCGAVQCPLARLLIS